MARAAGRALGDERPTRADDPAWVEIARSGLGVYVHVPFCSHRCGYCDFAAFDGLDDLMSSYVDRVIVEIDERVDEEASTVFVGGGTPSLLGPDLLARLVSAIPRRPDAECTVEMNPESATVDTLRAAYESGANRVSFGMQSARRHVLEFLERRHPPGAVPIAVDNAREAGLECINVDLVYGTPNESAPDWEATLEAALRLEVDHISAYALTVEEATPLGRGIAAGQKRAPDDDTCADRLDVAVTLLAAAGYTRYEVSNWSRSEPCEHNMGYWSGGRYIGIGSGAHSYDPTQGVRSWNFRHPKTYIEASCTVADSEQLTSEQSEIELLMLGLRRSCGMEIGGRRIPGELVTEGLVVVEADRMRLSDNGLALLNSVVTTLALSGRD